MDALRHDSSPGRRQDGAWHPVASPDEVFDTPGFTAGCHAVSGPGGAFLVSPGPSTVEQVFERCNPGSWLAGRASDVRSGHGRPDQRDDPQADVLEVGQGSGRARQDPLPRLLGCDPRAEAVRVVKLLDRIGRRGPIVMAVSAVVVGVSLQPLIGTDGWAGLGQWVGGLGALVAAWVALDIAGREARHREEADAHQDFVRANFIVAARNPDGALFVRHIGPEPVLALQVTAYRRFPSGDLPVEPIPLTGLPVDVLMPDRPGEGSNQIQLPWDVDPVRADTVLWQKERMLREHPGLIEIEYTDLRGNRWARAGADPARPAPPSNVAEVVRSKLPKRP